MLATTAADVVLLQEHRQRGREQICRATAAAKKAGWNAALQDASPTEKDTSGGLGCAARQGIPMARLQRETTCHQDRWAPYRIPGRSAGDLTLISVWGYTGEGPTARNKALIAEVATYVAGLGGAHWLAAGDWNLTPEDFVAAGGAESWVSRCQRGNPRAILQMDYPAR